MAYLVSENNPFLVRFVCWGTYIWSPVSIWGHLPSFLLWFFVCFHRDMWSPLLTKWNFLHFSWIPYCLRKYSGWTGWPSLRKLCSDSPRTCVGSWTDGMIIFPATGVFSELGPMGVSMFFISTLASQLVYTLGGSGFAGANGSMMIEVVVRIFLCILITVDSATA